MLCGCDFLIADSLRGLNTVEVDQHRPAKDWRMQREEGKEG
jgi:hypothetical protein